MFVGRMPQDMTKEDLYNYFTKFGEVTDVYIPKPYRCFGFVTFLRSDVATIVANEDHIYKVPLRFTTPNSNKSAVQFQYLIIGIYPGRNSS